MNPNKIKKNPTTEIKEKLKKSKFDLLTNENDFLVKSLKKAGQLRFLKLHFDNNLSNLEINSAKTTINQFFEDFKISPLNISFLLKIKNSCPTINTNKKYPLY